MGIFNEEQLEHMAFLRTIPDEQRCWCGWFRRGSCTAPGPCPAEFSLADKKALLCSSCGAYPLRPGTAHITHWKGCDA